MQLPGEKYLWVMNLQAEPGEPSAVVRSIYKPCFYVTQLSRHGQIGFMPVLPISAELLVIFFLSFLYDVSGRV